MVRAKVTSKGQITIPIAIRQRYGLETGDHVEFRIEESGPRMVPLKKRKLTDFFGALPSRKPFQSKAADRAAVGRYLAEKDRRLMERLTKGRR